MFGTPQPKYVRRLPWGFNRITFGPSLSVPKILEEQTLSHAKEANQGSEEQADESKHGQEL